MTKRIFAFFAAILILVVSVPAFAVSFSDWNSAGAYAGDLSTLSSLSAISDSLNSSDTYRDEQILIVSQCVQRDQLTCAVLTNYGTTNLANGYFYNTDGNGYTSRRYGSFSSGAMTLYWIPISAPLSSGFSPSSGSSWSRIAQNPWKSGSSFLLNVWNATQQSFWIDQSVGPLVAGTQVDSAVEIPWPSAPSYSGPGTILLQPGNLLIFEKSGGFAGVEDITITAENLPRSPLVGPWTTRNTIKSFPTLPDPSSVFVLPYSEWTAIPGTADWLGRSTSGSFVWRISQYTDDYAVYLNPIFGTDVAEGGLFGGNQADYNPFNKVLINDVSAYDRIMLVPVINRYGQSYIDYDSGSVIYDVSFNDDGTPEYSEDGESVDSGVANKPGGATSIDDPYVDTVGGILGLLERGAEAIRSLTSGAQSFFAAIRDMFTWLPQEIQTILVSALALVFAVGVIKILH